jgi:glucose-1-phosphate cytidylyltransferase
MNKSDIKVVILAGGLGTRFAEETETKPKPMIEIGERPILWHIMKYYACSGFKEFCLALGYKGEIIKHFFIDYKSLSDDLTIDLGEGTVKNLGHTRDDWTVHLIDTGLKTNTGGRVKRLEPFLKDNTFMLTYGDGVSNVDLDALLTFHESHGKLATVTAVRPPARFGGLVFEGDRVKEFTEKPQIGEGWINGGFMVLEPGIIDYLSDDDTNFERDCLEKLAEDSELMAFRHEYFWQCMDTVRDMRLLEKYWKASAPWRIWE